MLDKNFIKAIKYLFIFSFGLMLFMFILVPESFQPFKSYFSKSSILAFVLVILPAILWVYGLCKQDFRLLWGSITYFYNIALIGLSYFIISTIVEQYRNEFSYYFGILGMLFLFYIPFAIGFVVNKIFLQILRKEM